MPRGAARTANAAPVTAALAARARRRVVALGVRAAEARERWNRLLSTFGTHDEAKAQATLGLADIALQEGKAQEAIRLFQEVADSGADRFFQAQAGVGWGQSLLAAGESSQAADQFESVIRDFEDHPEFTEMAKAALSGL